MVEVCRIRIDEIEYDSVLKFKRRLAETRESLLLVVGVISDIQAEKTSFGIQPAQ